MTVCGWCGRPVEPEVEPPVTVDEANALIALDLTGEFGRWLCSEHGAFRAPYSLDLAAREGRALAEFEREHGSLFPEIVGETRRFFDEAEIADV